MADSPSSVFENGQAGFVVSHFAYVLSKDAKETGACPQGITTGYATAGDVYITGVLRAWMQRNPSHI